MAVYSRECCGAWNAFYPASLGDTVCFLKITLSRHFKSSQSLWSTFQKPVRSSRVLWRATRLRNKKHIHTTPIETHRLYFAVGIQIQNTTIHGAFTQLFFFPVSVCFLYKRVSEEKQRKPVTINAVKGDLRKHVRNEKRNATTHSCRLQKERQSRNNTQWLKNVKLRFNKTTFC